MSKKLPQPDLPCCWLLMPEILRSYAQYNFPTNGHAYGNEIIDTSSLCDGDRALRKGVVENLDLKVTSNGIYSYQLGYAMIRANELRERPISFDLTPDQIRGLVPVLMNARSVVAGGGRCVSWRPYHELTSAGRDLIIKGIRDALFYDVARFDAGFLRRCQNRKMIYSTDAMLDAFCNRFHVVTDDLEKMGHEYLRRKKEGRFE